MPWENRHVVCYGKRVCFLSGETAHIVCNNNNNNNNTTTTNNNHTSDDDDDDIDDDSDDNDDDDGDDDDDDCDDDDDGDCNDDSDDDGYNDDDYEDDDDDDCDDDVMMVMMMVMIMMMIVMMMMVNVPRGCVKWCATLVCYGCVTWFYDMGERKRSRCVIQNILVFFLCNSLFNTVHFYNNKLMCTKPKTDIQVGFMLHMNYKHLICSFSKRHT